MAHLYNLSTWEAKEKDCHDFEADLGHIKFQASLSYSVTSLKERGGDVGERVQSMKLLL